MCDRMNPNELSSVTSFILFHRLINIFPLYVLKIFYTFGASSIIKIYRSTNTFVHLYVTSCSVCYWWKFFQICCNISLVWLNRFLIRIFFNSIIKKTIWLCEKIYIVLIINFFQARRQTWKTVVSYISYRYAIKLSARSLNRFKDNFSGHLVSSKYKRHK